MPSGVALVVCGGESYEIVDPFGRDERATLTFERANLVGGEQDESERLVVLRA